jgi:NAD(P)H dehydrogenase (quinone)
MRHAVILSHPDPASFNAAIARSYVAAVKALGQSAVVRDLYAEAFDPRLPAIELPWSPHYALAPAVAAERGRLATADVIAFVYPLWFNAPPAMLKGYVERVFGMGFGYGPADNGTRPLLMGKSLVSISTSGAPTAWVGQTGAMQRLREGFDDHLAAVCGLSVLDHLHLGGVTPGIRADAGQAMLDKVTQMVRRHFAPVSLSGAAAE